jgi:uncharacterized protein (DUF736 family)
MENDSYNANNLNEYHNQIIEKIKNSDFGNLYEKNQTIIQDNLRKYKIIHMEYGKYGKIEYITTHDGRQFENKDQWGNKYKHEIDNFYIIYISINGDCFGNYLNMYGAFNIIKNYMGYVLLDWDNELFKEPFNKGLSTISEKIITKTILEDTISRNIILYFISKASCQQIIKSDYIREGLMDVNIFKIHNSGFKFKNIFVLQEEYIQAKIEEQKRREEEEQKEKQKRIEKVSKRIEEAQKKIKEEEQQRIALELDRVNFQNKIINELIKDTNNYINYNEAKSIISMIVDHDSKKLCYSKFWYFRKFFNEDINTILAEQVLNKFASENKIRVEDSINIFTEHIVDIANIFKIDMTTNMQHKISCIKTGKLYEPLYGSN